MSDLRGIVPEFPLFKEELIDEFIVVFWLCGERNVVSFEFIVLLLLFELRAIVSSVPVV